MTMRKRQQLGLYVPVPMDRFSSHPRSLSSSLYSRQLHVKPAAECSIGVKQTKSSVIGGHDRNKPREVWPNVNLYSKHADLVCLGRGKRGTRHHPHWRGAGGMTNAQSGNRISLLGNLGGAGAPLMIWVAKSGHDCRWKRSSPDIARDYSVRDSDTDLGGKSNCR